MDGWRKSKLVEIAAKKRWALNGGPFGSKLSTKHYADSGVPVIRGTNLSSGSRFSIENFVWVSEEKADELLPNNAHPGDLVFTQRGTIGQVGLIPLDAPFKRFVISQSQMKITPDLEQADPLFLYYFFTCTSTVNNIKNLAFATGVPHINLEILRNFEVPVPPLTVQRRIAGILLAYDELIENSQRRIQILESMARALYREWFVHFRFPGHQSIPLVPSSVGKIPQGWEVRELFELTKVKYGKNLPTKLLVEDGEFPVYGAAKVIGRYSEYTREHPTIICGCRGSVGEVRITQPLCYVTNNSFTFDLIQSEDFFWLFHALQERGLRDVVGGAAQPQITLEGISSVKLASPPFQVVSRFQESVSTIFNQAWLLNRQIQNLRTTRDVLLPRLLSGQIDVEALAA